MSCTLSVLFVVMMLIRPNCAEASPEAICTADDIVPVDRAHQALLQTNHVRRFDTLDLASIDASEDTQTGTQETGIGSTASFDEAGYQSVAAVCCTYEMEVYIRRLIKDLGFLICNEYGLLGFVPWYSCEKNAVLLQTEANHGAVQSYQKLVDNLKVSTPPAKCAFVAKPGACPVLEKECKGSTVPQSHRRRNCGSASTSIGAVAPPPMTTQSPPTTTQEVIIQPPLTTTQSPPTTTQEVIIQPPLTTTTEATTEQPTTTTTTTKLKMGLLCLQKNGCTAAHADLFKSQSSWLYTYDHRVRDPALIAWMNANEIEFVPMVWGRKLKLNNGGKCDMRQNSTKHPTCTPKDFEDVFDAMKAEMTGHSVEWLMGANEPWGESEIPIAELVDAWRRHIQPAADASKLKLISPTFKESGKVNAYTVDFLKACHDYVNDKDFPCDLKKIKAFSVHHYKCKEKWMYDNFEPTSTYWMKTLKDAMRGYTGTDGTAFDWDTYLETTPIWMTETNCNWDGNEPDSEEQCKRITQQKNSAYERGSIYAMENSARISRWVWWNLYANETSKPLADQRAKTINARAVYDDGTLTPIGKALKDGFWNSSTDCSAPTTTTPVVITTTRATTTMTTTTTTETTTTTMTTTTTETTTTTTITSTTTMTTTTTTTITTTTITTTTTTTTTTGKRMGLICQPKQGCSSQHIHYFQAAASWLYTYDHRVRDTDVKDWMNKNSIEFVPMVPGQKLFLNNGGACYLKNDSPKCTSKDFKDVFDAMKAEMTQPVRWLMGANEPWNTALNVPAVDLVDQWRKHIQPAADANQLNLVSPSFKHNDKVNNYTVDFMKACHDHVNDKDFPCDVTKIKAISIHHNKCKEKFIYDNFKANSPLWMKTLKDALRGYDGKGGVALDWDKFLETTPIWVTETNCDWDGALAKSAAQCRRITQQAQSTYEKGSIYAMEHYARIHRWAWHTIYNNETKKPPNQQNQQKIYSRAVDDNGNLMPVGRALRDGFFNKSTDCTP